MEKFLIGDKADPAAELVHLLEYNGFAYRRDGDRFRVVFTDRGCKWETVCICREQSVLFYGLYPFPLRDAAKARELCGLVNSQVLFGALFPSGERLVFRTCADLFDLYSAYESLGRALEYNASVMVRFWRQMSACALEKAANTP